VNAAREWATRGDVTWARMDTPRQPMVVTILLLLADSLDEERLQAILNQRLLSFARFRQRLVRQDGRHAWVEDPAFELNDHIEWRRRAEPTDQRALEKLVGELASQPLDACRPLWRCVVVENLEGGCAVVFRVHHCLADGIALLRVFLTLTDRSPNPAGSPVARAMTPEEWRSQAHLAAKTAKTLKPPADWLERLRWGGALLAALLRQPLMMPDTRTALRGPLNRD